MMIVSVMRDELRNEFEMADEVFALSPISARAVLPSEEDYDAISQAFMETSRGRWFLGEYAKRNRNADTRMVLDAVARIEETLAAPKQPPADNLLPGVLASIRAALEEAQAAAGRAVESLAIEENLAPVRKAARIIREISWRWREIGADARICDLLDSQVVAIEGACGKVTATSLEAGLSTVFDPIRARIAQFDDNDNAPQSPLAEAPAPSSSTIGASDQMPAVATPQDTPAAKDRKSGASEAAANNQPDPVLQTTQAAELIPEVVDEPAETANTLANLSGESVDATSEASEESAEAADAYDEALLDMIATEMAAPDFIDIEPEEMEAAAPAPAQPIVTSERPEPTPAPTPVQPSLQPSLGSTLIANGIVRKPDPAGSDPLAPIRRMSQAEKIALFS
jgi:chemotaxis protein histidine kinase CheA